MTHNKKWCHGIELCTSWIIADILCNCASIWNLVLISIDRAIAISYPFRYREMITKRKAYLLIALVWSGSILMAFLGMLNWTFPDEQHIFTLFSCQKNDRVYYTVAASVGFFLPLVIILISYGKKTYFYRNLLTILGRPKGVSVRNTTSYPGLIWHSARAEISNLATSFPGSLLP